jgi:hypothetical protein
MWYNLVKCPMSPILEKNMLDNFEFIWRSHYRVQSYLDQDASISKSETPRSSTKSGVCNSCHSYDTKEYKNLLQATSYLWLALQGPALSLARLRYMFTRASACSNCTDLHHLHATNAICIPLQRAVLNTPGATTKQHIHGEEQGEVVESGCIFCLFVCCMTIVVVVCAWRAKSPQAFWIP